MLDSALRSVIRSHLAPGPATRLLAFTPNVLEASDISAVAHLAVVGTTPWPIAGATVTVAADPLRLPFATALFDAVIVVATLEHSDAPVALIREVRRVIAPAGVVVLAVPRRRIEFHNRLAGQHYSRSRLERLLVEAMLEPVDWHAVAGCHVVRAHPRGGVARAATGRQMRAFRTAPA